mgnify:CR=1 FL=1
MERLAPYVEAEVQLDVEPLEPDVAAQIITDMISSAMARAAAQAEPPTQGARRAR